MGQTCVNTGRIEQEVTCKFEDGTEWRFPLSDCSLALSQYTRDYGLAVDLLEKATIKIGAVPTELIEVKDNALRLLLLHSSLCRDRNTCVYTRKEYEDTKTYIDLAFAQLNDAVRATETVLGGAAAPGVHRVEELSFLLPWVNSMRWLARL
jgi:hypothetical protein